MNAASSGITKLGGIPAFRFAPAKSYLQQMPLLRYREFAFLVPKKKSLGLVLFFKLPSRELS